MKNERIVVRVQFFSLNELARTRSVKGIDLRMPSVVCAGVMTNKMQWSTISAKECFISSALTRMKLCTVGILTLREVNLAEFGKWLQNIKRAAQSVTNPASEFEPRSSKYVHTHTNNISEQIKFTSAMHIGCEVYRIVGTSSSETTCVYAAWGNTVIPVNRWESAVKRDAQLLPGPDLVFC